MKQISLKKLTLAKVECAELAQHLLKDPRSLNALKIGRNFATGIATRSELDKAAEAAYAVTCLDECKGSSGHASMAAYAAVAIEGVSFLYRFNSDYAADLAKSADLGSYDLDSAEGFVPDLVSDAVDISWCIEGDEDKDSTLIKCDDIYKKFNITT